MSEKFTYDLPGDKLKEYKAAAGIVCPICGSEETETGVREHAYRQVVECQDCGARYMEVTKVINVLLTKPYVIPLEEAKDKLMSEASQMLFLIEAFFKSAETHHTTIAELQRYVARSDFDHLLDRISEVYARIGQADGESDTAEHVRSMWEYIARSRSEFIYQDTLMGFD
jgi:Zn ribbon nucleic-acid-binding protein